MFEKILFATTASPTCDPAANVAFDLAKKYKAKLHILHVPHSSYAYCKHIVDEHVHEGAPEGEASYDQKVEKEAEEVLKEEYDKKLSGFKNYLLVVKSGSPEVSGASKSTPCSDGRKRTGSSDSSISRMTSSSSPACRAASNAESSRK